MLPERCSSSFGVVTEPFLLVLAIVLFGFAGLFSLLMPRSLGRIAAKHNVWLGPSFAAWVQGDFMRCVYRTQGALCIAVAGALLWLLASACLPM